jgi:hypothetical protein
MRGSPSRPPTGPVSTADDLAARIRSHDWDAMMNENPEWLPKRMERLSPEARQALRHAVRTQSPVPEPFRKEVLIAGLVVAGADSAGRTWMPLQRRKPRLLATVPDIFVQIEHLLDAMSLANLRQTDSLPAESVDVLLLREKQVKEAIASCNGRRSQDGSIEREALGFCVDKAVRLLKLEAEEAASTSERGGLLRRSENTIKPLTSTLLHCGQNSPNDYGDFVCEHIDRLCNALCEAIIQAKAFPDWAIPFANELLSCTNSLHEHLSWSDNFAPMRARMESLVQVLSAHEPWMANVARAYRATTPAEAQAAVEALASGMDELFRYGDRSLKELACKRTVMRLDALASIRLPRDWPLQFHRLELYCKTAAGQQALWTEAGEPAGALYRALDPVSFHELCDAHFPSGIEAFEIIEEFCAKVPVPRGKYLNTLMQALQSALGEDLGDPLLNAWVRTADKVLEETEPGNRAAAFWQYLLVLMPDDMRDPASPEQTNRWRRMAVESVARLAGSVDAASLEEYVKRYAARPNIPAPQRGTDLVAIDDWASWLERTANDARHDPEAEVAARRAAALISAMRVHAS